MSYSDYLWEVPAETYKNETESKFNPGNGQMVNVPKKTPIKSSVTFDIRRVIGFNRNEGDGSVIVIIDGWTQIKVLMSYESFGSKLRERLDNLEQPQLENLRLPILET